MPKKLPAEGLPTVCCPSAEPKMPTAPGPLRQPAVLSSHSDAWQIMQSIGSVDDSAAAACPTVDNAAAVALPPTVFGSSHEISPRIPAALLTRTLEYHSAPVDATLWWHRHRDAPAIFRQASYLWTPEQRASVDELWPPGWHRDDRHPLLNSKGTVRLSSSHNASGIHRQVSVCCNI